MAPHPRTDPARLAAAIAVALDAPLPEPLAAWLADGCPATARLDVRGRSLGLHAEPRGRAPRLLAVASLAIAEPRELWEALATREVIPMDWVAHPTRRFVAVERLRHRTGLPSERQLASLVPPSVAECLMYAGERDAVLGFEARLEELWSRLDHPPGPFFWRRAARPALDAAVRRVFERWSGEAGGKPTDVQDAAGVLAGLVHERGRDAIFRGDDAGVFAIIRRHVQPNVPAVFPILSELADSGYAVTDLYGSAAVLAPETVTAERTW